MFGGEQPLMATEIEPLFWPQVALVSVGVMTGCEYEVLLSIKVKSKRIKIPDVKLCLAMTSL